MKQGVIMYMLGASAYFLLEECSQTNLQSAIKFGFTFYPVFEETNFSRTVGVFTASCHRDSSQKSPHGVGWSFRGGKKGAGCIRLPFPLSFCSS